MQPAGFQNSLQLLQTAYLFTVKAGKIENRHEDIVSERILLEHRAYAAAAVEFSVMFLEAVINELFYGSPNYLNSVPFTLGTAAREAMIDIWNKTSSQHNPLLKKYNYFLRAVGKGQLGERDFLYEEIDNLVQLRNCLVNYKPDIETNLMGRFNLNRIAREGSPFFPNKCLGYGCALWAVRSSVGFADEVLERLGLTSIFMKCLEEYLELIKDD